MTKKMMLLLTVTLMLLGTGLNESRSFSRSIRWYRKDYSMVEYTYKEREIINE